MWTVHCRGRGMLDKVAGGFANEIVVSRVKLFLFGVA